MILGKDMLLIKNYIWHTRGAQGTRGSKRHRFEEPHVVRAPRLKEAFKWSSI